MSEVIRVENLKTYFFTEAGVVKAVDDVSFVLEEGEPLGIVGESGSGKTVTSLSIMRIVPPPGRIVSGKVYYRGENLLEKSDEEMRKIRGKKIAMVFQDPNSSLDPLFTVEDQLVEVIITHTGTDKLKARERALELLEMVRISEPRARLKSYPHELSGGMRQRVAIARALAAEPDVLIADEPTTNLDVTVQAQILELLKKLQEELKMNLILITHDMGIIAEMTRKVVVMYAGRIAEVGETRQIFKSMKHPYTHALLKTIPRIDKRVSLKPIPGNIPNLVDPPSGCRYHPRCEYAIQKCIDVVPELEQTGNSAVACHRWRELSLSGE